MEKFIRYQTFQNKEDFEYFTHILKTQKVSFEFEDYPINFIADKANNNFNHEWVIKLKKKDFEVANQIQTEIANESIKVVDPNYYLFEFTIDELKKVIQEKDAWSSFDVSLANKLLSEKGIVLSEQELTQMQTERINELSRPDEKTSLWVILGYISAIFGGLFGVFIGVHLMNHKRTLPNGDTIFDYSEKDRKHGKTILIISSIVIGIVTVLRLTEKI